jgi:hypothetical protein
MAFRDRLVATIRAARPVLESPGVVSQDLPHRAALAALLERLTAADPEAR